MQLSPDAYLLLGLTAIVGALVAALTFALLRFSSAAAMARQGRGTREAAFLSVALEEAVGKLKAQERATSARADASELLRRQIIDSLSSGLLVVGLTGDVRTMNPAARRMLRVPESAPLGDYRRLLDEPALSGLIDECLSIRRPISRRRVRLPQPRFGVAHLGVSVSPLFDESGDLHGAVCLFTDLTSVRQLEEQLHLKESLATVGELTAGIAHEFRNGLATIHGYSKLLDPEMLPDTYRPYVEGIRAEAESLGQVVTNFLNFARPAELTLSRVDLQVVCESAVEEFRAEARGLGGDITLKGEFGAVEGDEVLLRQAFSNLLRNAVEACSRSARVPSVVVESTLDQAHECVRISIDDNGPGIEPEARERVFHPFFTLKRSGTGLGLALVQKIIVFHNGSVGAEASPLGGARLHVTLPATP